MYIWRAEYDLMISRSELVSQAVTGWNNLQRPPCTAHHTKKSIFIPAYFWGSARPKPQELDSIWLAIPKQTNLGHHDHGEQVWGNFTWPSIVPDKTSRNSARFICFATSHETIQGSPITSCIFRRLHLTILNQNIERKPWRYIHATPWNILRYSPWNVSGCFIVVMGIRWKSKQLISTSNFWCFNHSSLFPFVVAQSSIDHPQHLIVVREESPIMIELFLFWLKS